MSKRKVNAAIRRYQADTTPAAIRNAVAIAKRRGGLADQITASSIKANAAAVLRDAISAEIDL